MKRPIFFTVVALAVVALAGRWDGDFIPLNPAVSTYTADAGLGITLSISPTNYYRVTCDKDFNAAAGPAQADGGYYCGDVGARCGLFRSTQGEKMYIQTTASSNRLAIQAANAAEVAVCKVHQSRN